MIEVRGMGDRRETVRYEEESARGSLYPPPKPQAGFTAKHPSKDATRPQLGNFAEFLF